MSYYQSLTRELIEELLLLLLLLHFTPDELLFIDICQEDPIFLKVTNEREFVLEKNLSHLCLSTISFFRRKRRKEEKEENPVSIRNHIHRRVKETHELSPKDLLFLRVKTTPDSWFLES